MSGLIVSRASPQARNDESNITQFYIFHQGEVIGVDRGDWTQPTMAVCNAIAIRCITLTTKRIRDF